MKPESDHEFRRRVERIIELKKQEDARKTAKAVVDTIDSIPVVREITIGVVSVLDVLGIL
jgi:hypothetical protein